MSQYRKLMNELHNAHQDFKKQWNDWRNGKLSHKEKLELKGKEPNSVTLARDKFRKYLSILLDTKLAPLKIKFSQNPVEAIDEVIEFLSVDIPAFRCGYAKEKFLTKLKSAPLTDAQKEKLQQIALDLVTNPQYRRELGDWARLMIKLADKPFLQKLAEINANSDIRLKANRMTDKILQNRKDLAASFDLKI
jgi:hypothetical protein